MDRIQAPTRINVSVPAQQRGIGTSHAILVTLKHKVRISPFWQP